MPPTTAASPSAVSVSAVGEAEPFSTFVLISEKRDWAIASAAVRACLFGEALLVQ